MACDCLVQEQLLTTNVGTENIPHNDVYLIWSLRSAVWCRREEVFRVLPADLPVNIHCAPGVDSSNACQSDGSSPQKCWGSQHRREMHTSNLCFLEGVGFWGFLAPHKLSSFLESMQLPSCRNRKAPATLGTSDEGVLKQPWQPYCFSLPFSRARETASRNQGGPQRALGTQLSESNKPTQLPAVSCQPARLSLPGHRSLLLPSLPSPPLLPPGSTPF